MVFSIYPALCFSSAILIVHPALAGPHHMCRPPSRGPAKGWLAASAQDLFLQWAEALNVFQQAADWIGLESRKSLWGQFWSAHQRFFKYLCIAAKVHRLVELARQELSRDKVSTDTAWGGTAALEPGWSSTPRLLIPAVCGHRTAVHRGGADPRGAG